MGNHRDFWELVFFQTNHFNGDSNGYHPSMTPLPWVGKILSSKNGWFSVHMGVCKWDIYIYYIGTVYPHFLGVFVFLNRDTLWWSSGSCGVPIFRQAIFTDDVVYKLEKGFAVWIYGIYPFYGISGLQVWPQARLAGCWDFHDPTVSLFFVI